MIFTDARGVLSSLRLSDVDLDASEEATRKVQAEPPPPTEEEAPPHEPQEPGEAAREPVLTLTNKDIGRAWTPTEEEWALARELVEDWRKLVHTTAEGTVQDTETTDEILDILIEMGARFQVLKRQFDFHTVEGIRAAAPALAQIADFVRSQRSTLSPEAARIANGIANDIDAAAVRARVNPEAVLGKPRQMKLP